MSYAGDRDTNSSLQNNLALGFTSKRVKERTLVASIGSWWQLILLIVLVTIPDNINHWAKVRSSPPAMSEIALTLRSVGDPESFHRLPVRPPNPGIDEQHGKCQQRCDSVSSLSLFPCRMPEAFALALSPALSTT